ncbi:hypothetical protein GF359_05710, partial [candidate division WOR-3 bacterium]|nr:hypothetical protein [candidate division WOR-3 bacterium]MBD3364693.1 hypothetical protein [candidate division WOR-3 bacterium]
LMLVRSEETVFSSLQIQLDSFAPLTLKGSANFDVAGLELLEQRELNISARIKESGLKLSASDGKDLTLNTHGELAMDLDKSMFGYDCRKLNLMVGATNIENRLPFEIDVVKDSLYLGPTTFFIGEEGSFAATVSWGGSGLPYVGLSIYDVELGTLNRMLGMNEEMKGMLSGQIVTRENVDGQRIVYLQLGALDVDAAGVDADSVFISGELNATRLDFDVLIIHEVGESKANGNMYYDLTDPDIIQRFNVNLTLDDIGVWPFGLLEMEQTLRVREGDVSGNINVFGTFAEPDIRGHVFVRDAELFIPVLELDFYDADVDILFSNGQAIIDRINARSGQGRIRGNGDYEIFSNDPGYFFSFIFDTVTYSPERHLKAVCDGKVTLNGTENTPMYVSGEVDIIRADISWGLSDQIWVTSPNVVIDSTLPPTYVDIHVSGDRNIWIKNNLMDVEVEADLDISQRDEILPQITGNLSTKRGNIYYVGRVLKLESGEIIFPPIHELNPELDIWARKRTDYESASGEQLEVVVHMSGTLNEPVFELFSAPPGLSETDIITYLSLGYFPSLSESDLPLYSSFPIDIVLRGPSGWFKERIGADVIMVEDIGLIESPTKVTVGKYLGDKWYASYTMPLSQVEGDTTKHQFEIEYSIGEMNIPVGSDSIPDTLDLHQNIILDRNKYGAQGLRYQLRLRY